MIENLKITRIRYFISFFDWLYVILLYSVSTYGSHVIYFSIKLGIILEFNIFPPTAKLFRVLKIFRRRDISLIKRSNFSNSRLILRISRVKQNFSFPATFNYPLASCIAFDWEKRKKEIFRVIQKQCAPRDIKKEETFRFELVELAAFFSCFQFRSRPPGHTKEILRSLPSFDSHLGFAPHFPWIPNLSTKRNVVPQPFDAFQISQTKTSQTFFFKPAINSGLDSSSFCLFLSSSLPEIEFFFQS